MKFTIRQAELKDLDHIRFLFRDTVLFINSADYNREEIKAWSDCYQNIKSWTNDLLTQHFLVAVVQEEIVGFSSITGTGYLDFLYIHQNFQRKGIAKALLSEIELHARMLNLKEIFIHVSKTAKPFFEWHGYQETGNQVNNLKGIEFVNSVMTKKQLIYNWSNRPLMISNQIALK